MILTDSQSECKAISNNNIRRYQNSYIQKIRERIYVIMYSKDKGKESNIKLVIGWIPGHVGILGNRMADQLVKESTEELSDDRILVPLKDWSRIFKEAMEERTQARIEREGRNKAIKFFENYYVQGNKKEWFKNTNEPRGLCTMINRLRAQGDPL